MLRILQLLSSWPTCGELSHGLIVHAHARAGIAAGLDVRALIVPYQLTDAEPFPAPQRLPAPAERAPRAVDIEGVPTWICERIDAVVPELLAILDEFQPQVVHVHHTHEWALARIAKARGLPLVLTSHLAFGDPRITDTRPELAAIVRAAMLEADRVIAFVEAGRRRLAAWVPEIGERIRVVGHGVDDDEVLRASALAHARPREQELVHVVFVGRFVADKGIDVLMTAIPLALERYPALRFVCVGHHAAFAQFDPDSLHDRLGPAAHALRIVPWGGRSSVRHELARADIFVSPSRFESFGLAIAEAMLAGLAIVATRTEGAHALLCGGALGQLVPIADAPALADAIVALARDPERRSCLGIAAANHVRAELTWAPVVAAMREVYEELAHSHARH